MAVLAHVLQLIGGWIAPLVIFFIRRQSRFVSFHALQVLLFEALCILVTMAVMTALAMGVVFSISLGNFPLDRSARTLAPFFAAVFAVFWLGIMVLWLVRLFLAIIYGVKAGRGEWAEYPVLGRLSRKILSIGPGGAVTTP
jgi:uncharacterized membrane protein